MSAESGQELRELETRVYNTLGVKRHPGEPWPVGLKPWMGLSKETAEARAGLGPSRTAFAQT